MDTFIGISQVLADNQRALLSAEEDLLGDLIRANMQIRDHCHFVVLQDEIEIRLLPWLLVM